MNETDWVLLLPCYYLNLGLSWCAWQRMAEDEDDAYMNAVWANPKALKTHLHGLATNMQFK